MTFYDPTFVIQHEPPNTIGKVTGAVESDGTYPVLFRGLVYYCKPAGKNTFAINDLVSFIDLGDVKYCVKSDAGYPTRWQRPLSDWRSIPANLFLRYVMRNNPKDYSFRLGVAVLVVSLYVLRVACWDGVTRDLGVEYAGVSKQASNFSSGDVVVLYQKHPNDWVVIGKKTTPAISVVPSSINFGNVTVGSSSSASSFVVTQTDSSELITCTTASPFAFADNVAGPWGLTLGLPAIGGTGYARFSPSIVGAASNIATIVSADANTTLSLSGTGTTGARWINPFNATFPQNTIFAPPPPHWPDLITQYWVAWPGFWPNISAPFSFSLPYPTGNPWGPGNGAVGPTFQTRIWGTGYGVHIKLQLVLFNPSKTGTATEIDLTTPGGQAFDITASITYDDPVTQYGYSNVYITLL